MNMNSSTLDKPKLVDSPLDKFGKITTSCINAEYGHIALGSF